jgi:hypothetical protein
MAQRGRPPKPVEQKKREGTYRKDRDASAGNLAVVPAVAVPTHELAPLDVFDRVVEYGRGWLAETDGWKLSMLRELLEERQELRDDVLAGKGNRKDLRDLDKQIMDLGSQMGFDPAARTRLGLAEVKAANKLEELRARRENR